MPRLRIAALVSVAGLSTLLTVLGASTATAAAATPRGQNTGSPARTTISPKPALIQPPGPMVEPPSLLAQAKTSCAAAGNATTDCAGALDALVWGYPLLVTTRLLDLRTCGIGLNKLENQTTLAGPGSTTVVSPNNDTLYSSAFLDLSAGPELLTVPAVTKRYFDFQLIDMYTNTLANIGDLTDAGRGGRYAIVWSGWHGTIPAGVRVVRATTPQVWLLGRTEVNGQRDVASAISLQHKYLLAPLDRNHPGTAAGQRPTNCGETPPKPGLDVLNEISSDMTVNPPLPQDGPIVQAMAAAGIGAGLRPSDTSDAATLLAYARGLRLGVQLMADSESGVVRTSTTGWRTHPVAGTFGTDYLDRAIVAKVGLAQQVPSQAVYFSTSSSSNGTPLSGGRQFALTFTPRQLPPLGKHGFWSLTMYDTQHYLVGNPLDRYSVGSHVDALSKETNGDVTIVMSASKPGGRHVNWLPAPAGAFEVIFRVYSPGPAVAKGGWTPPSLRLLAS